jgi:hypothetical protein
LRYRTLPPDRFIAAAEAEDAERHEHCSTDRSTTTPINR